MSHTVPAIATTRLAKGKAIPTKQGYAGAARLHTKTIEEMRADKAASQKNAEATDKAKERPAAKAKAR